jgi:hypothetical protein
MLENTFLFLSQTTFGSNDVNKTKYGDSFEASVFENHIRRKWCL